MELVMRRDEHESEGVVGGEAGRESDDADL